MAAQKKKKGQTFFAYLNAYYRKGGQIKALNSLDSSRPNRRLLQNPKTRNFNELCLPESDF